ncbi:MAG: SGNH/GDSL hydrolase family protein, partial [Thermoleophilaceae bacterium]
EYVNLGVAGATSPEVAAGQLDRAATLEPDLVTVLCGANDVLLSVRPDIDGYRETFGAILVRLGADAPEARVLTATCADFSPWLPMGPRSRRRVAEGLAALNEVTREVAAAHDAVCLDFAGHPHAGDRGNYAADGVHPSREGNERAASAFTEAVAELAGDARAPDHQPDGGP